MQKLLGTLTITKILELIMQTDIFIKITDEMTKNLENVSHLLKKIEDSIK